MTTSLTNVNHLQERYRACRSLAISFQELLSRAVYALSICFFIFSTNDFPVLKPCGIFFPFFRKSTCAFVKVTVFFIFIFMYLNVRFQFALSVTTAHRQRLYVPPLLSRRTSLRVAYLPTISVRQSAALSDYSYQLLFRS